MGRRSKIDSHPHRKKIIKRLASKEDYSDIIRDFPDITWDDLDYYEKNKLEELISKSDDLKAEIEGDIANDTLAEVRDLKARALSILTKAEGAGDLKTALLGIREARGCLELVFKAEGRIQEQPQINVLVNPQWVELRTLIVKALEPYPQAREAVVHAIRG